MGVVQLRRGANAQSGRATYYFSQASQTDTDDADYFFNLGYAYWLERGYSADACYSQSCGPTRSGCAGGSDNAYKFDR